MSEITNEQREGLLTYLGIPFRSRLIANGSGKGNKEKVSKEDLLEKIIQIEYAVTNPTDKEHFIPLHQKLDVNFASYWEYVPEGLYHCYSNHRNKLMRLISGREYIACEKASEFVRDYLIKQNIRTDERIYINPKRLSQMLRSIGCIPDGKGQYRHHDKNDKKKTYYLPFEFEVLERYLENKTHEGTHLSKMRIDPIIFRNAYDKLEKIYNDACDKQAMLKEDMTLSDFIRNEEALLTWHFVFKKERGKRILPPPDNKKSIRQEIRNSGLQLERGALEFWKEFGLMTFPTPQSNDYGIDGFFENAVGERGVIQSKQYMDGKLVSGREIREFLGAMEHAGVKLGIFITTSGFSRQAKEIASGRNIVLQIYPMDSL